MHALKHADNKETIDTEFSVVNLRNDYMSAIDFYTFAI